MSILRNMLDKWKAKRERKALPSVGQMAVPVGTGGMENPRILTPWGDVTESARLRAALNMQEDAKLRERVEELLARQLFDGDLEKGRAEAMRRYPEGYEPLP